jgi:hypothetical protein
MCIYKERGTVVSKSEREREDIMQLVISAIYIDAYRISRGTHEKARKREREISIQKKNNLYIRRDEKTILPHMCEP